MSVQVTNEKQGAVESGGGFAPGRAVGLVAAAAVVGAATLPIDRPGLGWLLTGLAVAVAVFLASPASGRTWQEGTCAAAALALLAVGTFRTAGWLFLLCVLTAVPLAIWAVAGPARVSRRGGWAALGIALASPRPGLALSWWGRGIRQVRPDSTTWQAIGATALAVVLLTVFGALFASADLEFQKRLLKLRPDVPAWEAFRVPFALLVVLMVTAILLHTARGANPRDEASPKAAEEPVDRRWGIVVWAIPIAALDALFLWFVLMQYRILFGGHDYVLGEGGPDYAVHARTGFQQLVIVTVLTLVVIGVTVRLARPTDRREQAAFRYLLGVLCVLTLVVVASAVKRMAVYVDAYGFTVSRLLGVVFLLWLAAVLVLLLIAGIQLRAGWLPAAAVAAWVGLLLGLAAINPEAYIANTVLSRLDRERPVDYLYLSTLSSDAADVLARRKVLCDLGGPHRQRSEPDPWYAFNLSRHHGRDVWHPSPYSLAPDGTQQRCSFT